MTWNTFTDEKIAETLAAIPESRNPDGSINSSALSRALNVSRSTAQNRIKILAEKGLLGFKPVLPGFEIRKVSSQLDAGGEVQKTYVRQGPERGAPFAVPAGHAVKGVSALVDADGRTVQQWIKTREGVDPVLTIDSIKEAFAGIEKYPEMPPAPEYADSELLTVYNIGDQHHGMLSWARETGHDYDLKISEEILLDAMGRLVASAPTSETAIILNLGDFFHSDSRSNRTEKSGAVLDVDSRYPKALTTGVKLLRRCVDLALLKHKRVIVRCLPGNHDYHTSLALTVSLAAFYDGVERVRVDDDPSKFFFHRHGKVMISATHGDEIKPEQMASAVAAMEPDMWGKTIYRVGYQGHVHSKRMMMSEGGGMVVETFNVLGPRDAWAASKGYVANRQMTSITHHVDMPDYLRSTVSYNQSNAIIRARAA